MKIGIISTQANIIATYFPTAAEPHLVPIEPLFTPDDQLVVNALREKGFLVQGLLWGATENELASFDALIFRSPWDYKDSDIKKQRFLGWLSMLQSTSIKILNPIGFIRWNIDKHYLRDLSSIGVPIIPTKYVEQGERLNFVNYFAENGAYITKPCISAGGKGLFHIETIEQAKAAQPLFNTLLQQGAYMLQPIIEEIKHSGEWSFIFIGGKYSHAIHKITASDSLFVQAERGGGLAFHDKPSDHLILFANHVYEQIQQSFTKKSNTAINGSRLLYMRVDVIDTKNGPVVIECEGVEPELFFRTHPPSIKLFVEALANEVGHPS